MKFHFFAGEPKPYGVRALCNDTADDFRRAGKGIENRGLARHRSGTIYIMAMGTSLIVACLAVASLQAVRVQRRIVDAQTQLANARKLAQAGIEFVQLSISSDPTWRTKFTHGVAVTRTTIGGSFEVTLTDPDDGVISNHSTDPIVINSLGRFGGASQKQMAYLEPQNKLYAACRSSLYAQDKIEFDKCRITSNQWAFCEKDISTKNTISIFLNCLEGNRSGRSGRGGNAGLNQRFIQGGVWPMEKPDMDSTSTKYVGRYYLDNSVAIAAGALPTGGTQLAKNTGFESNTASWSGVGCTIARDTAQRRSGVASCLVSSRSFINTPVQNITEHVLKGRSYTVSFWVRPVEAQNFYPTITCTGSGSVIPSISAGSAVAVNAGVWTHVSRSVSPTWSGVLNKAELQIGSNKTTNYHFDDVSLLNNDRVAGTRYIENVVLSDATNPFGSRAVSANGLYSIRVPDEKLVIRDCRINGTIVVTDATKTELGNAISWEPIGRNFPALISSEEIEDKTTDISLIESDIGVNFNPSSTPYNGASDSDASDTYPSVISGAIVSEEDILLEGVSKLYGPVISEQKITVKSSNLTIDFDSDMLLNPPPGFFADPPPMRLIPSSLQSVP